MTACDECTAPAVTKGKCRTHDQTRRRRAKGTPAKALALPARLTLRLPAELRQRLQARAAEAGRDEGAEVRAALEAHLK